MRSRVLLLLLACCLPFSSVAAATAFERATVTAVLESGENVFGEYQLLQIELADGSTAELEAGDTFAESSPPAIASSYAGTRPVR